MNIQGEKIESHKKIGEILLEQGIISEVVLKEALVEQRMLRQRLGEILIERGIATTEQINCALVLQREDEMINISDYFISPQVLSLIKEGDARELKAMPLFKSGDLLYVAMRNPNNVFAIDHLQRQTGLKIKSFLASEEDIFWAIEQYYGAFQAVEELLVFLEEEKLIRGERDQELAVVRLVNFLIARAVHEQASDIHLEPDEATLTVRYRIDGLLRKRYTLPKYLQSPVISRVKILANLDISEKRLPQDGRTRIQIEAKEIDFRVSTCPTVYGENVVLRILDKSTLVLGLEFLGFSEDDLKKTKEMIVSPYGMILVTGPTGSGKTTTLYSALQLLNKEEVNIMTVEDPVEYDFPGMHQVHVNPRIGLNFTTALRCFLRQDPDIIMVGEIRDFETAEIAIRAALTGHLVFSTLHTNDAPTAFSRLLDMGVEPFLVSSSLLGVLAQRLTRKVCPKCKEEYQPSSELVKTLGIPEDKISANTRFMRGKGCSSCMRTGYKGRTGIFELLRNTPTIRDMILSKASADEIRNKAIEEGMITLRESALEKLLSGVTTAEEVIRVTQEIIE